MQFPKLTPLQSRFAVSLAASIILVIIYFFLWSPHFAYAAELDVTGDGRVRGGHDHNWARIADLSDELDEYVHSGWAQAVAGDEELADVDILHEEAGSQKRAAAGVNTIPGNNSPGQLNIDAGENNVWVFPNATLWGNYTDPGPGLPSQIDENDSGDDDPFLRRELKARDLYPRQDTESRKVFISINTCLQPGWNASSTQTSAPPQLTLYVSNDTSNVSPGPNVTNGTQVALPLGSGFANFSINATGDVYMSVSAPSLPKDFSGLWNYDLAVSIDGYYHASHNTALLHLVDTDSSHILLVTDNLTQANPNEKVYQEWMNLTTPFMVFAQNDNVTSIWGLENSFCGLKTAPAQIIANSADPAGITEPVQMGMITRGLGNKPKEQFYIRSLNSSSSYSVYLAMNGNSTQSGAGVVGGGGQVWQPVKALTKSDGNCALIFNLTFCNEVAYAVPSNPYTYGTMAELSAVYDNYTANLYQNFNYSLQQIPCNTTSSAQYSTAKNCDDCAAAYKEWLCAVSMPRCEDFSSQYAWLQPRNMGQEFINHSSLAQSALMAAYTPMSGAPGDSMAYSQQYGTVFASNSSRNPAIIDEMIRPGPYKEVLPCEDLCYSLMQSCPAALGFGCPYPGRGLETDYGARSEDTSNLTCSYLGAVYYLNDAGRVGGTVSTAFAVAGLVSLVLLIGV